MINYDNEFISDTRFYSSNEGFIKALVIQIKNNLYKDLGELSIIPDKELFEEHKNDSIFYTTLYTYMFMYPEYKTKLLEIAKLVDAAVTTPLNMIRPTLRDLIIELGARDIVPIVEYLTDTVDHLEKLNITPVDLWNFLVDPAASGYEPCKYYTAT